MGSMQNFPHAVYVKVLVPADISEWWLFVGCSSTSQAVLDVGYDVTGTPHRLQL